MANNLVDQTGVGADKNKVNPTEVNKGMVPNNAEQNNAGGQQADKNTQKGDVNSQANREADKELSAEERHQARLSGSNYPHPVASQEPTRSQSGRPNQSKEVIEKAVANGQSSGIPDASGVIHRSSANVAAGGTPSGEADANLDRKPGVNELGT